MYHHSSTAQIEPNTKEKYENALEKIKDFHVVPFPQFYDDHKK